MTFVLLFLLSARASEPGPAIPELSEERTVRDDVTAWTVGIRAGVNPFWVSRIHSLPARLLTKGSYSTVVTVVVGPDGRLLDVVVTRSSGVTPLDDAVTGAFRDAAAFAPPPLELLGPDGRAAVTDLDFLLVVEGRRRFRDRHVPKAVRRAP